MRFAYADPVYLGCSRLYPEHAESHVWDNPDTHRALVAQMVEEFPDGWAMSLSSPSLRIILPMCPPDVRVAAWVKTFCAFKKGVRPAYSWEPVIYRGGRNPPWVSHPPPPKGGRQTTPKDFLAEPITSTSPAPDHEWWMVGGPRSTVTSLTVAAKLWPTPATTDASGHGYAMDRGERVVKTLSGVADAMWPKPSTAMVAGYTKDEEKRGRRTSGGHLAGHQGNELLRRASSLPDPTISLPGPKSSPTTRRLNPRFVAWLMGVPVGWTDTTTPLERTSFERWATESSRWLALLLCAYSSNGPA